MTLMIIEFIAVIMLIVVWWCGLFAALSGLGLLGRRAFGLPVQSAEAWILSFWSGWVFTILILQFWHLCLKIDVWAFAFILALGSGGLLWNRKDLWQVMRACRRRNSWLAIILLVMALWIANRAIGPIQNGDTGLYHMGAVTWAASYPIVPGLGNLHERLAFNSSFFLYAAMLGVSPWVQKSYYLANGLPLLVLLVQLIWSLQKIVLGDRKCHSYHLFNVLLLPPALGQVLHPHFSSLSPDVTIFIIGILLTSRVYYFFINSTGNIYEEYYNFFLITILCTIGMTIKLSFIPLGSSTLFVALAAWFFRYSNQDKKKMKTTLFWILLVNMFLLSIWVVRGVILSGYILFPYTFGSLPVTWRVPRPLTLSVANWIGSWARAPGAFWTDVLDNWNWLWPWLKNFPNEYIKPLIAGMFAIILYLITIGRIRHNSPQWNYTYLAILGPSFISSIFWFFSAPDPRFSGAYFWIFGAGFAALAIENIGLKSFTIVRILECILCLSFFVYLFPPYSSLFIHPNQKDGPFYNFPTPEYISVSINNLTRLNLPTKGDQCWDIPIPCTPYVRSNIHLRKDNLDAGFILDNTITFADMHQGSLPGGITVSPGLGVAVMQATWYKFEEEENIHWMRTPGKILVYTEHATYTKLSLKPFAMNVQGSIRNEGKLKISLNNSPPTELSVKSGMITEAVLGLRPDFNIITLDLAAAGAKPNDTSVGNADPSGISVAFYSIDLTSIVLLK
jgi:hypothetical protein